MTHGVPYPTIDVKATGANIQRLRKRQGLKVQDLQGYFGFESCSLIYCWEEGERLPDVAELYALSSLLRVSMDDIIVPDKHDRSLKVMIPWSIPPMPGFRQVTAYPGLAT